MSDKEFRAMFARIPKNSEGNANEENVYIAFRNIIGVDLLTPERFQEAKQKRFKEVREFQYDDCAELFNDIDHYLENIPVEMPRKTSSLTASITKGFRRIIGKRDSKPHSTPSFIEERPPAIPEPKTPPLSDRVDALELKIKNMESQLTQVLNAQKRNISSN